MRTHKIKKGESLALEYSVENVSDLTGYQCIVNIVGVTAWNDSAANMQISDDKRYFRGNIRSVDTESLIPKMYIIAALISNVTDANDYEERQFEIRDKLIVEPSEMTAEPPAV